MIYVLAFFLPPVALLVTGHVFQAILNGALWIVLLLVTLLSLGAASGALLICSAWAIIAIAQSRRRAEHREIVEAARQGQMRR